LFENFQISGQKYSRGEAFFFKFEKNGNPDEAVGYVVK
jgi:hypothetical protein